MPSSDAAPPPVVTLERPAVVAPSSRRVRGGSPLPRWLRWHRRLGLTALAGVVIWCVTGILHPIMTRLQPEPAQQQLQVTVPALAGAIDPASRLLAGGVAEIVDLRVILLGTEPLYQVTLPGRPDRLVLEARDGAVVPDGDRRYAEWLARQFTGEERAGTRADLVTEPGHEYSYVNRLLPVWRIEFDRPDGLRAFVDTRTGRLGALVDNRHAALAIAFNALHRWLWLQHLAPAIRLGLLSVWLAAAVAVAAIGLRIYVLRWRQAAGRWGLRRVHRVVGLAASIGAVILPISGATHLLYDALRGDGATRAPRLQVPIAVDQLRLALPQALARVQGEVAAVSTERLGNEVAYRFQLSESPLRGTEPAAVRAHDHGAARPSGKVTPGRATERGSVVWVSAADGRIMEGAETAFLLARALLAAGRPPTGDLKLVEQFDGEYGFVFKRLPVWRIGLPGGAGVFVDPSDGAIAAVTDAGDRAEQWFFAHVHKLEWLVGWIGGTWRDGLAMFLTLVLGSGSLLGGVLALRRRG